ncbi:MAG: alpha/beta hydrolase [Candidatus Omnitrophica bacterium]|nr:alpha/beta hydrolase [Candidatus Omnitrophota bacterium]
MIIISFKERFNGEGEIPDVSFYLNGNKKDLCILVHGLTGTPREMAYVAKGLNENGYSVKALLLDGHNKPLSVLKRKTWQDFYAGIREDFLKCQAEYDNIYVAGLSFGALLSLMLAHEFPEKIRAVTCFSPTLFFNGWGVPKARVLLPLAYFTPLKYYAYFKEEYPYGLKNEKLRARVEAYYKKAALHDNSEANLYGYPVIPVSCMYQNHLLSKRVRSMLGEITTPIQLLQAREDDVTSPKNSTYIYEHIASKDKEIKFFENSYHIITADQERDKVVDATVSFFNKHKQA